MPPLLAAIGIGATAAAPAAAGLAGAAGGAGSLALMEAGAAGTMIGTGSALSLGSLASGAMLAGTGLQAIGSITKGNTEAAIAEANADASRMEARSIVEATKAESARLSREGRQIVGRQASIMGASGLDLTSGSPLEAMLQTTRDVQYDIQQTGYAGGVKAASKMYEGTLYDWLAPQKRTAGYLGAGTALLSGFGQYAKGRLI